jgi:hypothetical protein
MKKEGRIEVQLHAFIPRHYIEKSGQLYAQTSFTPLPKKIPQLPIGKETT